MNVCRPDAFASAGRLLRTPLVRSSDKAKMFGKPTKKTGKSIQGIFRLWKVDLLEIADDWQLTNEPRRLSVAWLGSDRPGLRQPVLSNAVSKYQDNYC